jgi:hypothetical protein
VQYVEKYAEYVEKYVQYVEKYAEYGVIGAINRQQTI